MVLDICVKWWGQSTCTGLRRRARGAMGKMDEDDFYGQVCKDENIKSGTGWRVDRVVRLQGRWRHRTQDGMGETYGGLGWGVYTDPEPGGSLRRLPEDVPEGKPNKQSVRHRRRMKLNDETKRGECMTSCPPEV